MSFGLFVGATSIILMAWSFLLAVRLAALEPVFGGLDSMYRVHRWAGAVAVIAMFLHTRAEPEIENGVRGASRSVAESATDLAGAGEIMLYVLVGVSLLRWIPYRWWRWTHKLLGVPFAFACWHFYTAEKTYANRSAWGIYFGAIMLIGLGAFVTRVLVRDSLLRGHRYRVRESNIVGSTLELVLEPRGQTLKYKAGQFVVLKVQARRLSEPHIFTVASAPSEGVLRFFIRDLGDWTAAMHQADLNGAEIIVEGPYGAFEPLDDRATKTVWVAGGVGITPFLSAAAALPETEESERPTLFYAVRSEADAMALATLRTAQTQGKIDLQLCSSADGERFSVERLQDRYGSDGLNGAHVAVCGPTGLVATVRKAGPKLGSNQVEHEDFDIRQGFGPDLSRKIAALTSRWLT